MAIPTLQGIQTALSGLLAQQEAMDTTSNNIANANTAGYSRETAVLEPTPSLQIANLSQLTGEGAWLGTGVTVQTISRVRNSYLDSQYRTQNSALSAASTATEELEQTQSAFNEPSSVSIASELSTFWTSWSELANDPTSEASRESVVAAGQQLTQTLNQVSTQLQTIAGQAEQQIAVQTGPNGEEQSDAKQIAQLNGQIKLAEEAGQKPNEMLDRRDLLLDKLSSLANINVSHEADGTDKVTFGDAEKPLVEGTTVNWPQKITAAAGGELGTLLGLTGAKGTLAGYKESLDNIARTLNESVNALHGAPPFFTGTTAATIKVAVKASEVKASGTKAEGGNEVARAIAELRGGAADQAYSALVEQVGSNLQVAKNESANLKTGLTAIENQRQSVSGVSLDEEMTNLIAYQRGYQASARTLTALDDMLETVIEHTGRVGL
jgi:flagellar hook-associated protein 1 FlgK